MAYLSIEANEEDGLLNSFLRNASPSCFIYSTFREESFERRNQTARDGLEKSTKVNTSFLGCYPSIADKGIEKATTLYEKKCLLIDHEIDSMVMGRYQWFLWGLCGSGYLLDLMWAQTFGLILSPMQQEFGFGANQTGQLSTPFSCGLAAGSFIWGFLIDIIGRKWAFSLSVLFSAAFLLTIGTADTFTTILVFTTFTGFGIGGNIPVDTTIILEFKPQNERYLVALLSTFQPIGVVLCTVLAYKLIPNYSCSPNFSEGDEALPACSTVSGGQICCSKYNNSTYLLSDMTPT